MKTVDDYIAHQSETAKPLLEKLRRAIRRALPKAEEVIAYNMPTYKIDGKNVVFFAAWKNHCALYPATKKVLTTFATELEAFEVEKGTIRLAHDAKVSTKLIEDIAKLRAKEAAPTPKAKAKAKAKPSAKPKPKAKKRSATRAKKR